MTIHPRAIEFANQLRLGQIDLGMVLEIIHRLENGQFKLFEASLLYDKLIPGLFIPQPCILCDHASMKKLRLIETIFVSLITNKYPPQDADAIKFLVSKSMNSTLFALAKHSSMQTNVVDEILLYSIQHNQIESSISLIDAGASVNPYKSYSLIKEAAKIANVDLIDKLIARGADLQWEDDDGNIVDGLARYMNVFKNIEPYQTIMLHLVGMGINPERTQYEKDNAISRIRHNYPKFAFELQQKWAGYNANYLDNNTTKLSIENSSSRRL